MFMGSIPATMQKILKEITNSWDVEDIYVGCSGNFTIERMLNEKFKIHSNDVTVYSYALGMYFTGQDIDIKLKDEYKEQLDFMEKRLGNNDDKIATVMMCTKALGGLNKDDNLYYKRINNAYRNQWDKLIDKTSEKLKKAEFSVNSYYNGDVIDFALEGDKEQGFVCFPPFFAKDYKNMFSSIEEIFDWKEPEYTELSTERKDLLLEEIQSYKRWIIGLNYKIEALEDNLIGMTKTTNRGMPIYIYGNSDIRKIVTPSQTTKKITQDRLGENEDLEGELSISVIDQAEFQTLRSLYMNKHINPGQASLSVGVYVGGKLIGVYAFLTEQTYINFEGKMLTPHVYLLSDFPVAPTKYKHLAKLVLFAALSKESKLLAERLTNKRVRSLTTTAFSKRPVSMKYRGLFELYSRKENEIAEGDSSHSNQKFTLNYYQTMGQWDLGEGFEMWKKRYGDTR